jgi:hypothetical protein
VPTKTIKNQSNPLESSVDNAHSLPFVVPTDLSDEEKVLLAKARTMLADIRNRMAAVMRAAAEHWQPAVESHQVDETAVPYLSDEEFDDIANVTELMAEMASLRDIGFFFGLPQPMIDAVVQERLRAKLVPTSGGVKGPVFVASKRKSKD